MTLLELIQKYGEPKILLDDWDHNECPKAIFDFEEIFLINHKGEPVLNGEKKSEDPLLLFQKTLNRWKVNSNSLAAVGYISYDFKNLLFPYLNFKKINNDNPILWFAKPKKIVNYKIKNDTTNFSSIDLTLIKNLPNPDKYEQFIKKIKTYLSIGESYQINFTQPKKYIIKDDPFNMYLSMREIIQPWHGMYINTENLKILSFTPEKFFKTYNGIIESIPMKGTYPRSKDLVKDELLKIELQNSSKDRAEHLMIVDLIRNDIGKISQFDSVKVENLYDIQSFKTVHQMISKVYGKLSQDINEIDIIKAMFPGGSITGAPKERSMEIIDSLENYNRGIYTGALGSISNKGEMNFNIAIRTMSINNSTATYPVGGGIVWDSNSLLEWKEAQQKSKIIDICQKDNNIKSIKYKFESCINK